MVTVPVIALLDLFYDIALAVLAAAAFVGIYESLTRIFGPFRSIGLDPSRIAWNVASAIAGWARWAVSQVVENAYAWVIAPVQNLWETQWRQRAVMWWTVARLFAMRDNVVWLRSAVGSWPGGASLTDRVTWLSGLVDAINAWRNNFEYWTRQQVGFLNALIAATEMTLRGEIAQAKSDTIAYTDTRERAIRTDVSSAVSVLQAEDRRLSDRIEAARAEARSLADQARSQANAYTDQRVAYTAEVLRAYTDQRVETLRAEMLDRMTAITRQLEAEISGVRNETRVALMQLVRDMAALEANLRAELRQRVAELTAALEQTRGALTAELRAAIADVMKEIQAERNRLTNVLLAEAAALMELAGTVEGTLAPDVVERIRRAAEQVRALQAVGAVGLGIAIAGVLARVVALEADFGRLRRTCIDPTCRAWLPSADLKFELLDAIEKGAMLAILLGLLRDPVGTANQLRAFAEPVARATWDGLRAISGG